MKVVRKCDSAQDEGAPKYAGETVAKGRIAHSTVQHFIIASTINAANRREKDHPLNGAALYPSYYDQRGEKRRTAHSTVLHCILSSTNKKAADTERNH